MSIAYKHVLPEFSAPGEGQFWNFYSAPSDAGIRYQAGEAVQEAPVVCLLMVNPQESSATETELFQEHWLYQAVRHLVRIGCLEENWDYEGSPPPKLAAMRASIRFINFLADVYGNGLSAPFVCPIPGGGVQLEWTSGTRDVEIEFTPDGGILYLRDDDGNMESGEVPPGRFHPLRRLFDWLLS